MAELGDLGKMLVSQGMLVSYGAGKFSFEKQKGKLHFDVFLSDIQCYMLSQYTFEDFRVHFWSFC